MTTRIIIDGDWFFANGWWQLYVPETDEWYAHEIEVPERAITAVIVDGVRVLGGESE